MSRCALCDDACSGADLAPLLQTPLDWLWTQIAEAADRRGDASMSSGTLNVTAPADPAARAAALGLLGERPLTTRRRRIDLAALTGQLRHRGVTLTPGAVAAHARGSRLAQRSKALAEKQQQEDTLRPLVAALASASGMRRRSTPEQLWDGLRRTGWIARLHAQPDPTAILHAAERVLSLLPEEGARVDRRRLAEAATGDPHALDETTALAGLVLGTLTVGGAVLAGTRSRVAWSAVGVDLDDLTGGLLTLGLRPAGWQLPHDAIVTMPPRVLNTVEWAPPPKPGSTVFITENPSVIAAAANGTQSRPSFVVCTSGTPAASEITALSSLTTVGWQVLVRADFDVAGIEHVRALLEGIPGSRPWRMSANEYERIAQGGRASVRLTGPVPETLWDRRLQQVMTEHSVAVYEESLLTELLDDLDSTPISLLRDR